MTDHRDPQDRRDPQDHRDPRLSRALHRLRRAVRDAVPVPSAIGLRARAARQQRVRRAGTVALAAAAVAAVVIGGDTLLDPVAGPPAPPAQSPTPSADPVPSPTPTPVPTPTITPDPRPAPQPLSPLDDPIVAVDWLTATITIPPRDGCPIGEITFAPVSAGAEIAGGPPDSLPRLLLNPTLVEYGDLTGDGRAEAVLEATCTLAEQGGDHGQQLLVVSRAADGSLTALDWVGPRGAYFGGWWVAEGRLLVSADPWVTAPEDHFVPVPGLALTYTWDGTEFTGWEPAPEYPPLVPLDPAGQPPVVRPGKVADWLGCGDEELRFVAEPSGWGWTASSSGGTYAVSGQPLQHYLFDLDLTGVRLLVMPLRCVRDGGGESEGLAVFELADGGWRGISVLLPPPGSQRSDWQQQGKGILVSWVRPDDVVESIRYEWTGSLLVPAG